VPRCQRDYEEYGPEDGELERGVVAGSLGSEDQAGYERHRERDSPVEAARFGVGPGVHGAHHLASIVGVGTVGLGRAVVADLGPSAVTDQAPPVIHLAPEEDLVLGGEEDQSPQGIPPLAAELQSQSPPAPSKISGYQRHPDYPKPR
jgi:hypothetical protein